MAITYWYFLTNNKMLSLCTCVLIMFISKVQGQLLKINNFEGFNLLVIFKNITFRFDKTSFLVKINKNLNGQIFSV